MQVSLLSAVAQTSITAPTLKRLGASLLTAAWLSVSAVNGGAALRLAFQADIPGQVFVSATLLGAELPCFTGQGAEGALHCLAVA